MNNSREQPDNEDSGEADEPAFFWRHPDLSDDLHELFLERVAGFESEPTTTLARLLIEDGIELPPPDTFTEDSVREKLWEVIHGMARHRHYLFSTDHLSDLALYQKLWEENLNDETEVLRDHPHFSAWHIDLAGCGSEESIETWLCFYADEADREEWRGYSNDGCIPDHIDPPYDRARQLPKSPLDRPSH